HATLCMRPTRPSIDKQFAAASCSGRTTRRGFGLKNFAQQTASSMAVAGALSLLHLLIPTECCDPGIEAISCDPHQGEAGFVVRQIRSGERSPCDGRLENAGPTTVARE